jgi:hypothetical protein
MRTTLAANDLAELGSRAEHKPDVQRPYTLLKAHDCLAAAHHFVGIDAALLLLGEGRIKLDAATLAQQ